MKQYHTKILAMLYHVVDAEQLLPNQPLPHGVVSDYPDGPNGNPPRYRLIFMGKETVMYYGDWVAHEPATQDCLVIPRDIFEMAYEEYHDG